MTPVTPVPPRVLLRGDFEACFRLTMSDKVEGGFSNDPNDRGGPTNHGVSLAAVQVAVAAGKLAPDVFYILDKNRDGKIDIEDVKLWTEFDTRSFYKVFYWMPIRGFELPAAIAMVTFDSAVNEGPETAIQHLQRTVGVKVDGIVGPDTIKGADLFVRSQPEGDIVVQMTGRRLNRYRQLADADRYFRGWANRSVFVAVNASQLPTWGE